MPKELPHAQWICGPDAEEGHLCECSDSEQECACLAVYDPVENVVCRNCGEPMISIDFASGEAASTEQRRSLMAVLDLSRN